MADSAAKELEYGKFWPYLKRVLGVIRPEWKWLYLDLFFSGLLVLTGIFSAGYTGFITDAALDGDWNLVWHSAGMLGIFIIITVITVALLIYTENVFTEFSMFRIRRRTAFNIENLPVSDLDMEKSGDLLSRLNNDIRLIKQFFREGTYNLMFQPLMFIGGVVYTLTVNWKLTLLTAGVLPVIMYFAVKITKPIEKHTLDTQEGKSDLNVIAQDSISGFTELKSFTLEDEFRRKTRGVIDRIIKKESIVVWYQTFISPINKFMQILPTGALYFFGGLLVFRGEITIGEIVIFSNLLHYIASPFQAVSSMLYTLREFIPGVERVFEIWDKPGEKGGQERRIKNDQEAVEFSNVSFYYKEDSPVLRGTSFIIPRGEVTALVGHSGCGKTTVIKLLSRFYIPREGAVKIFGTSYEAWDLEEVRRHIALVNQDTYLFPDTIYRNILYGRLTAS
ncbi:MAG: ABC transporter ATP-binding protein, partial [Spirochaetia bacterium]